MTETNHRREHDARSSDAAHKRHVGKLANGLMHITTYVEAIQEDRPTLIELRVKCDPDDERGVLIIGKGYLGAEDKVCFHRDLNVEDAVAGFGNRLRNGSLNWRHDEGYQDKP